MSLVGHNPSAARAWKWGLALGLCFLALRLAPLRHGLPRTYVPDSHMVKSALGMAQDRDLVPPVGKYSSYPYLVPYMLLPVYGAQYLAGRAQGRWQGPGEFALRAKLDPGLVHLPARALTAFLGALVPWALFACARAAGLRAGAWAAAGLAGTALLHVQFSTHERPWTAVVLFGALCHWACAAHVASKSARSLLAAGAAAGASFAAHQAGAIFLALTGLAWLAALRPAARAKPTWGRALGQGLAALALFALVGLCLGHAYYLRHGDVPQAMVAGGESAREHFSIGGQALRLGLSAASALRLSKALLGYDPLLVLLGLGGMALAWRRAALQPALAFTVLTGLFFLFNPSDHVRYLLPVTLGLCLPAGELCQRLWSNRPARALVLLCLSFPALQAARLVWLLRQEDSRAIAERELERLGSDEWVAVDHYGPQLDLSREALQRLADWRGELRTREAARLELLRAGADVPVGVNAIFVEELFEHDPRTSTYAVKPGLSELGSTPQEVLARLGVTHFLSVSRRGGANPRAPLAELARAGKRLVVISPARDPGPPRESFLPTEMDFPLTGLWQVERPGPYMELYDLRRASVVDG